MPFAGVSGIVAVLLEDACQCHLIAIQFDVILVSAVGMRITPGKKASAGGCADGAVGEEVAENGSFIADPVDMWGIDQISVIYTKRP